MATYRIVDESDSPFLGEDYGSLTDLINFSFPRAIRKTSRNPRTQIFFIGKNSAKIVYREDEVLIETRNKYFGNFLEDIFLKIKLPIELERLK